MNEGMQAQNADRHLPWRAIGWGAAVALLTLPFVAMQVAGSGVSWTVGDFVLAGLLFAFVGGMLEVAVRLSANFAYRVGFGLALLAFLMTVWVNLAVGIVGSDDAVNSLFFAALLLGIGGAIGSGLKAEGMARAALATAIALVLAFVTAQAAAGERPDSVVAETIGTSIFVMLFLGSAWHFRRAARQIA